MFPSSFEQDLTGCLLVASPLLAETNFAQSLIYICRYSTIEGALGVVINRPLFYPTREDVFKQLKIPMIDHTLLPLGVGGPVEAGRGFILHSSEWRGFEAISEGGLASLNASIDILNEIARGQGPKFSMLVLGHAGWAPGQLEKEIYQDNSWYIAEATQELVFGGEPSKKWERALENIGIKPAFLSLNYGES